MTGHSGERTTRVKNARSCQEKLDMAAQIDAAEGIRQGLDDARRGRTRPVRKFFEKFEARSPFTDLRINEIGGLKSS
jgi:hypothetical protein